MIRAWAVLIVAVLSMTVSGCVGSVEGGLARAYFAARSATCGDQFLEAVESSMSYTVDSLAPGATTGLQFEMAIPAPSVDTILKPREIVITLPAEFVFLGFDALGNGAQVGSWDFDWSNPDGTFDSVNRSFPHYAIDANNVWSDNSTAETSYQAGIDPIGTHSLGAGGVHVLTLILPSGGADDGTNCSYFETDVRYTLYDGIVQLPSQPGAYDISIAATSVDPDTGDADNGTGIAPSTYNRTVTVTVPEPSAALLSVVSLFALSGLRAYRVE